MNLDMKFQWVRLVTSTQARQHTHTQPPTQLLAKIMYYIDMSARWTSVGDVTSHFLGHYFHPRHLANLSSYHFLPLCHTFIQSAISLSALFPFNLVPCLACFLWTCLWDPVRLCFPPNRDNSTRTDKNKAPVLMYTKKSGYLIKKWINFFLSLHTYCIVCAESVAQLCWISVRKAAQWNWLMLINDLWCQWSRNYLHILEIAAEVGNSASAQLWNAPPWRSCAQMSVHVGQITAAPAVCWSVAANSLNHLHVSSECFKVVVVFFLFFLESFVHFYIGLKKSIKQYFLCHSNWGSKIMLVGPNCGSIEIRDTVLYHEAFLTKYYEHRSSLAPWWHVEKMSEYGSVKIISTFSFKRRGKEKNEEERRWEDKTGKERRNE